ncbi:MAG: ribosomal protein L7/L12, partial [Candidatus Omnitrophica bacterium]|nr:ribosomal protein L7/L12 [Candidatus Omnitrophota bacterium]
EAKELVDSAPKKVKENITKEEAEEIKKKLEAAGAAVELK